jgi:hypothetical protein
MLEMELLVEEVISALREPKCSYPGRPCKDGGPTRVMVAGRVAVVVATNNGVVITVLWAGRESRTAA